MSLPSIDVEELAKQFSQYDGGGKRQAKDKVQKFVIAATLLEEKFSALEGVAVEMARENVSLRLENEALKSAGQAVITPEHFWNLETAILNGVREIFSQQSESAYQPVVNPPKHVDLSHRGTSLELAREEIDLIYDEEAQEYEAICYHWDDATETECEWRTEGSESVCDEAAWEHAKKHTTSGGYAKAA